MFWCGVTSIAHLAAIALERWYTMTHIQWSVANRDRVPKHIYVAQLACWVYGALWAVLPLTGIFYHTADNLTCNNAHAYMLNCKIIIIQLKKLHN